MARRILFINPPVLAADAWQVCVYAEAVPFGLIQIATHFIEQGDSVDFIDMMGYLDGDFESALAPAHLWGVKPAGDIHAGAHREVYLYGRSLAWLDEKLSTLPAPDEVFVTCAISFNYEPAYQIVKRVKRRYPNATVRFGGAHPTSFPEHAAGAGADEVFVGRFEPAASIFPDLSFLDARPPIWLFRLVSGCKYNCSFCANATHGVRTSFDPRAVADEIIRVHERFGIETFSNWDPNVMLEPATLETFLDLMADRDVPVRLKFEMGVQPDRLTPALAAKMKRAGVVAMTIPFESAEPDMLRRFGKPYGIEDAIRAVALGRDQGLDTGSFHCTWVVGIRDESFDHVFRTWAAVLAAGGLPTPFPLTLVPGTREAERHQAHIEGKDLSELNGHLWPALASNEQLQLYDLIMRIITQPNAEKAMELGRDLPREAREALHRALDEMA